MVKIIEEILYDEKGGRLTIAEIAESIKKRFDLSFSDEEIKTAIRKKGRHIQNIEHGYILKPDYRKTLSNQEDFNSKISRLTQQAIKELNLNVPKNYLIDLLKEYLYFCFIKNAKHFANGDNPEQVNFEIQQFIRTINDSEKQP